MQTPDADVPSAPGNIGAHQSQASGPPIDECAEATTQSYGPAPVGDAVSVVIGMACGCVKPLYRGRGHQA